MKKNTKYNKKKNIIKTFFLIIKIKNYNISTSIIKNLATFIIMLFYRNKKT